MVLVVEVVVVVVVVLGHVVYCVMVVVAVVVVIVGVDMGKVGIGKLSTVGGVCEMRESVVLEIIKIPSSIAH